MVGDHIKNTIILSVSKLARHLLGHLQGLLDCCLSELF